MAPPDSSHGDRTDSRRLVDPASKAGCVLEVKDTLDGEVLNGTRRLLYLLVELDAVAVVLE